MLEVFGAEDGPAGAGEADDELGVEAVESAAFGVSLVSAGLLSPDDSADDSELFAA